MNKLKEKIKREIYETGPITVSKFMGMSLHDNEYGYYKNQNPIGAHGDFITSPEISQIFGEIIALWIKNCCSKFNHGNSYQIVDVGGGRGTLLKDIERTIGNKYFSYIFVDINPYLIKEQKKCLPIADHYTDINEIPEKPTFFILNEFLDALPIKQFMKQNGVWKEVCVDVENDTFKYCYLNPENPNFLYDYGLDKLITEDFYEVNIGLEGFIKKLSKFLNLNGGVALVIDYGYSYGSGDTLQAIQNHKYVDPLEDPGKADLTAHINFSAVKELCKKNYLKHHGPTTQRNFLINLGALSRLENLIESNNDIQTRNNLTCGLNRLIKKKDMGDLFKVMALFPKNNFIPEGFD